MARWEGEAIEMVGVVLIIVAMVLVVPVGIMLAGAVWSALMGNLLVEDANGGDGEVDARE